MGVDGGIWQLGHLLVLPIESPKKDEDDEPLENREVYLNKVARRVQEYKITHINPLRPGKKLLVLDIDYTLFDHRSPAETALELMRPFLHEFLTAAYEVS